MPPHFVTIYVCALVGVPFVGLIAPEGEGLDGILPVHEPILIEADTDLTPENGVIGGSGSEEDPFVIAGWTILAPHQTAITIKNTTSHLLIADNDLIFHYFDNPYSAGIRTMSASNISIERNMLSLSQVGIQLLWSSNIRVDSNTVHGLQAVGTGTAIVSIFGIGAFDSQDLEIVNNEVSGYGWGINVQGGETKHVSIDGNSINNVSQDGVAVYGGAEGIDITNNDIRHAGITLVGINVRVEHNTIVDVFRDFDVFDSKGITIAYNAVDQVFSHSIYYACEDCRVLGNVFERMGEGMVVNDEVAFTNNVYRNNDVVIGNETDGRIIFHENDLDDSNEVFAIANGVILDLTDNWWGDEEGPDSDKFETVNGGEVIVEPWLTNPPV